MRQERAAPGVLEVDFVLEHPQLPPCHFLSELSRLFTGVLKRTGNVHKAFNPSRGNRAVPDHLLVHKNDVLPQQGARGHLVQRSQGGDQRRTWVQIGNCVDKLRVSWQMGTSGGVRPHIHSKILNCTARESTVDAPGGAFQRVTTRNGSTDLRRLHYVIHSACDPVGEFLLDHTSAYAVSNFLKRRPRFFEPRGTDTGGRHFAACNLEVNVDTVKSVCVIDRRFSFEN